MPEAAMDKYGGLETSQYYIRIAWKVLPMEAETISAGMQVGAHNLFRRCIAGPDPRHDPASFIRSKRISQNLFSPFILKSIQFNGLMF